MKNNLDLRREVKEDGLVVKDYEKTVNALTDLINEEFSINEINNDKESDLAKVCVSSLYELANKINEISKFEVFEFVATYFIQCESLVKIIEHRAMEIEKIIETYSKEKNTNGKCS